MGDLLKSLKKKVTTTTFDFKNIYNYDWVYAKGHNGRFEGIFIRNGRCCWNTNIGIMALIVDILKETENKESDIHEVTSFEDFTQLNFDEICIIDKTKISTFLKELTKDIIKEGRNE